ncbi:hypothetical protein PVK74_10760 [Micromonospora chalcea]|uniref:hypothetical protein n=1 Tax=Micromonospora chalcea TaxID=1874 RepID=UPI002378C3A1|nr:hypothetical protein [Micromonospora chalcea]WDQ02255.1 hypothetical protein PVK74_10760 [Micromonospora chalcea]
MTMASLRYLPLGQIHVSFTDVHLAPGVANHRLVLPVQVTGTWLDAKDPQSNAQALLTGTVWTEQPSFRWLAGLEPQVVTLHGYAAGEELAVSLTDDQLIALERARALDDVVLRFKIQATLLAPPHGVHPVTHEELQVRVARTRWLELMDQVGTEVGVLVRIPSPLTDSALTPPPAASDDFAASLAQAAARLRQARAELRDQQWEALCGHKPESAGKHLPVGQLAFGQERGGHPGSSTHSGPTLGGHLLGRQEHRQCRPP